MKRIASLSGIFLGISLLFSSACAQTDQERSRDVFKTIDEKTKELSQESSKAPAPSNTVQSKRTEEALRGKKVSKVTRERGAKEVDIYEQVVTGTVLVVTSKGSGTGVLITERGHILSNEHVVGDAEKVAVIFKPAGDREPEAKDIIIAEVIKVDPSKDLALLKIAKVPAGARPVALSPALPKVGEEVHAIGHPIQQLWTYTKGYVSAIRPDYSWGKGTKAKVIQTQTPINMGNSGGPLVSNARRLVGINTFIHKEVSSLNYAVSVEDVKSFLKQKQAVRKAGEPEIYVPPQKQASAQSSKNIPPQAAARRASAKQQQECGMDYPVRSGMAKSKEMGTYDYVSYDAQCTGEVDMVVYKPRDISMPYYFMLKGYRNGKGNILLVSETRNAYISSSLIDLDGDGEFDAKGIHVNGAWQPQRVVAIREK